MAFSWNEHKRLTTLNAQGLDFADAGLFFDGRPAIHEPSPRNDENRWKTTALIEGTFYTVVWMWRGGVQHIISMRRAHAKEVGRYREFHIG